SLVHGELSSRGYFRYINAGHPQPLCMESGKFQRLESTGMILGPQLHSNYEVSELYLPPGAALILFTHGLSEHHTQDGSEFGIDGLKSWMLDWQGAPSAFALKALFQRLYDFGHAKPFHDDVTALYIRRN